MSVINKRANFPVQPMKGDTCTSVYYVCCSMMMEANKANVTCHISVVGVNRVIRSFVSAIPSLLVKFHSDLKAVTD